MPKLVTIYGGSGFVGRYIAQRMARAGWRVRVAVRRPNEAMFVRPYGVVGQVEPVLCNIRDDASVRAALIGADAAVNCVGTFDARGKNNFDAVQHLGAARVARLAAEAGVARMVQVSAIGADAASRSEYQRSKAAGEAAVLAAMPNAMILRPSIVFGPEDNFFNRFAAMTRLTPVIPLFGAGTRFQPVYVEDIAEAAAKGVMGEAHGLYELGGPEVRTFRELVGLTLQVIRRRRLVIGLPFWKARAAGRVCDAVHALSGGVIPAAITYDQALQLRSDNVVSGREWGFEDLGISPTAMEAVLASYLWQFRPAGQYTALQESARNLKRQP